MRWLGWLALGLLALVVLVVAGALTDEDPVRRARFVADD
jgi:hypothetical protein